MAKKKYENISATTGRVGKSSLSTSTAKSRAALASTKTVAAKQAKNISATTGKEAKSKAASTTKSAAAKTKAKASQYKPVSSNTGRSYTKPKSETKNTKAKDSSKNHFGGYKNISANTGRPAEARKKSKSNLFDRASAGLLPGSQQLRYDAAKSKTKTSAADKALLSDRDYARVNAAKQLYESGMANRNLAHAAAELARKYNPNGSYSGGSWGNDLLDPSKTDTAPVSQGMFKTTAHSAKAGFDSEISGILDFLNYNQMDKGEVSSLVTPTDAFPNRGASTIDIRDATRQKADDLYNMSMRHQMQATETNPLPSKVAGIYNDVIQTGTQVGMETAVGLLTGGVGGRAMMAAKSYGSGYREAMQNADPNDEYAETKATAYATSMALTEILGERMFGGAKVFEKAFGKGFMDTISDTVFKSVNKTIEKMAGSAGKKAAAKWVTSGIRAMFEEGAEEGVTQLVQSQLPRIYGGDIDSASDIIADALHSAIVGAIVGGGAHVASIPMHIAEARQTGLPAEAMTEDETVPEESLSLADRNRAAAEYEDEPEYSYDDLYGAPKAQTAEANLMRAAEQKVTRETQKTAPEAQQTQPAQTQIDPNDPMKGFAQRLKQAQEDALKNPVESTAATLGKAGAHVVRTQFAEDQQDASRYSRAMLLAYSAGYNGTPISNVDTRGATFTQAQMAYEAGKTDAENSMSRQIDEAGNAVAFSSKSAGLDWESARGSEHTSKTLSEVDAVAKRLGLKVQFVDKVDGGRANASVTSGVMLIEKSNKEPLASLFGHEITHRIQETAPEEYRSLRNTIADSERAVSAADKLVLVYKAHGRDLSFEDAMDEVVADYVGAIIYHRDVLEDFANKADRSTLQKVLDALRTMIAKLRGKYNAELEDTIKRLEEAYLAAGRKVDELIAKNNQDPEVLAGEAFVRDDTGEKFSSKSMEHDLDEGTMLRDLVLAGIMTKKEAEELEKNIRELMEYMKPFLHIVDWNEEFDKDNRPYSPIKSNSDKLYKLSLDFSTLCRKRLLLQSIIEKIQKEEKKAMSPDRQMKIRELLKKYHEIDEFVLVSCHFCYVESARLKSPKQVNSWLSDMNKYMTKYFAKKDSAFDKKIKQYQYDFKIEHGEYDIVKDKKGNDVIKPHSKSDMEAKWKNIMDEESARMRESYKLNAEQKAIVKRAKKLPKEYFLSAEGMTKLAIEEPVIYDAFVSAIRSATRSKTSETPVPYYYGDTQKEVSDKFIQNVLKENGFRANSWSDWQVQHLLDMITAIIEFSVRGIPVHKYTKFPEEVEIFGDSGIMYNMSGVLATVEPIYDEDKSYSLRNFDTVEGVDIRKSIEAREKYPDKVGVECVGVSKNQILALIRCDWLDYVIPYHASGLQKAIRERLGIGDWDEYTKTQEAKPIDKEMKSAPEDGNYDAENWHKEPVYSEFMDLGEDYDVNDGVKTMRLASKRYVKLCEERGMTPKFKEILDEEPDNYWKLLIDRKMVNQKTGKLIEQKPLRPIINFEAAKKAIDREVKEYDPSREARAFNYLVEHAPEVKLKRVAGIKRAQAALNAEFMAANVNPDGLTPEEFARQAGAETGHKTKNSIKMHDPADEEYFAAIDRGDMEAVQQMVLDKGLNTNLNLIRQLDTPAYYIDPKYKPKKTKTIYKVFNMINGQLYPLYVQGQEPLPVGTFMKAKEGGYRFTAKNGKEYVPATTGGAIEIPNDSIRQELIEQGYLPKGSKAKSINAVAYRPGWHGTTEPFFPQGGRRDKDSTYGNIHSQGVYGERSAEKHKAFKGQNVAHVVCKCTIPADVDYTDKYEHYDKKYGRWETLGRDMQKLPENGSYEFRTNTQLKGQLIEKLGEDTAFKILDECQWYVADALRIDSVLTEDEVNGILTETGIPVQEWENGKLDLEAVGYKTNRKEADDAFAQYWKLTSPITYDDNGNIIPLSERFNPEKNDPRYSIKYDDMIDLYGDMKPGEEPAARREPVPKQTSDEEKVSQTIRTVIEAGATPDSEVPTIQDLIERGEFSYEALGDKESIAKAEERIMQFGFADTYASWSKDVRKGIVNKDQTTLGWILYNNAVNSGDTRAAMSILSDIVRHQRNAAQALQATRILKKMSPQNQLYSIVRTVQHIKEDVEKKYKREFPGIDVSDDLAQKFIQAKTPAERVKVEEEVYKEIAKQLPASVADKWNAWRYLAMLFNLRTHIRNLVGNAGFAPIVASKNVMATAAEIAIYHTAGKKRGMQRTKGIATPALFSAAWADYPTAKPEILGEAKYNDSQEFSNIIEENRVIFKGILRPVEAARKFNSKALDAEDSWFSRPHYANALAQYCAANHITAEMLKTGVGITESQLTRARAYAIKEAQKATYRDLNNFSEAAMKIGKSTKAESNKVMKWGSVLVEGVLPFRKTPANILVRAVEYSPLGFANGLGMLLYGVPKGKCTIAQALDAIAAGTSGIFLFRVGLLLASLGILKPSADDDDDQKYFDKLRGHQEYAIELNGTSYTVDWLAPEVIPMLVGAEYFVQMSRDTDHQLKNLLESVDSTLDPILELSCLSGINEMLENLSSFKENGTNSLIGLGSSMTLSYFMQGIPTLFGQLERSSQADRMTTWTTEEGNLSSDMQYNVGKISAKIPGWDYQQIPYIDAWGNTTTESSLWKRTIANMVNPAYVSKISTKAVEDELHNLYDSIGDAGVYPERANKTYKYKDSETGEYKVVTLPMDEYVQYARAKGRESFTLLDELVNSKAYKQLSDNDKVDVIKRVYKYADYKAAQNTISDYKGTADSWITNFETFASEMGNYKVGDYILVKNATSNVTGYKNPDKPDANAIAGTSSLKKLIAVYDSGVTIPSDTAARNAFLDELGVTKTYWGYSREAAEQYLAKTRARYGITEE